MLFDAVRELEAAMREAEVVWAGVGREPIAAVRKIYRQLQYEIGRHVVSQRPADDEAFGVLDDAEYIEMRRVVTSTFGKDGVDSFGNEISAALEVIREICAPRLGKGR